jgi:hypothetical protein
MYDCPFHTQIPNPNKPQNGWQWMKQLLKFSFAHWALDRVFQLNLLNHLDSAVEAYAELAVWAIPVCTSYTFATQ